MAALMYAFGVVAVALFPLHVGGTGPSENWGASYNLLPFASIANPWEQAVDNEQWGSFFLQVAGNIALTVPLGILMSLLSMRLRTFRACLALTVGASAGIELLQLACNVMAGWPHRAVDVDDVALNVIGGMIGFAIYRAVTRAMARKRRQGEAQSATGADDRG